MTVLTQTPRSAAVRRALATVALLSACSSAQRGPVGAAPGPQPTADIPSATTRADTAEYRALQRRLASHASLPGGVDSVGTTDFAALRRTYAQSSDYAPYDSDVDLRQAMFGALERSAFGDARRFADSALTANYLDIFGHIGAAVAAAGLADAQRAAFHRAMAGGLMSAILASGDGTETSPWVVLSVDEEYALLQTRGLTRQMQSMGTCAGGRSCDVLTVIGQQGGSPATLYFDISWPTAWLSRQFKAPPGERVARRIRTVDENRLDVDDRRAIDGLDWSDPQPGSGDLAHGHAM